MYLALIAAGFVFAISLYSVQPALVAIEQHFEAPLGAASLGMSLPILGMVIGSMIAPLIARDLGRFMGLGVIGVGIAGIVGAWLPTIEAWGMVRLVQGLLLAAIPALAMAGLGTLYPTRAATMVGLFTGVSAVGAAAGRMSSGLLVEQFGVPVALTILNCPALLIGVVLLNIKAKVHLSRPKYDVLRWRLYLFGSTLLFTNLLLSNMLPYWLTDLGLSVSVIGLLFFIYLAATVGSSCGGWLADRIGTVRAARIGLGIAASGIAVMAGGTVAMLVGGFALVLFGLFAGHAVSSGVSGLVGSGVSGTYVAAYYVGGGIAGVSYPAFLPYDNRLGLLAAAGAICLALFFARRALEPERRPLPVR